MRSVFATTRWTMVVAAGGGSPQAGKALAELCEMYWVPLYAYLRRKGHPPAEAEDIVQAFFARLIEKADMAAADPRRGRFRSFLIGSLQHFVANRRDYEQAQKRGGGVRTFSLDVSAAEARCRWEPWTNATAEKIFDRQWAIDLLGRVLQMLGEEYERAGKSQLFAALQPMLAGVGDQEYSSIAEGLQMSAAAVKMAASRMRRRYRERLRETIADTVASPEEVEDEIRQLFEALRD